MLCNAVLYCHDTEAEPLTLRVREDGKKNNSIVNLQRSMMCTTY